MASQQGVKQFFDKIGKNELFSVFWDNGFESMDVICSVTDEDLKELGIDKMGVRKTLLLQFEEYKKKPDTKNEQPKCDPALVEGKIGNFCAYKYCLEIQQAATKLRYLMQRSTTLVHCIREEHDKLPNFVTSMKLLDGMEQYFASLGSRFDNLLSNHLWIGKAYVLQPWDY